jgi:hypothetical protein
VTKLLVLLFGLAWFVRFRLRKNPRLRARIYPWTLAACAALLLLATNLGPSSGPLANAFHLTRLAIIATLVAYMLYDIQRTLAPVRGKANPFAPRGPR